MRTSKSFSKVMKRQYGQVERDVEKLRTFFEFFANVFYGILRKSFFNMQFIIL